MDTITNDVMEFDVYKSSRGYVKSNTSKHSCKSRNYWRASVQTHEPLGGFKTVSPKNDHRLKISKVISTGYISHREVMLKEEAISFQKKIDIKGNVFFISNELNEIAEEILFSEELLDFVEDFECEKTLPVNQELYFTAIRFLIEYSEFIFKNLGVIIQAPEINAGRNGNVYLAWRTDKARLAISVEKSNTSEVIANYYGDLGNDREPIKGNVAVSKISEYLAYWMKYLS